MKLNDETQVFIKEDEFEKTADSGNLLCNVVDDKPT
jgi:hypothetical protein